MKTLIITEDVVKIKTLTGRLGKTYSFLYLAILSIRLKLAQLLFPQAQVLTSYGQHLARISYSKNRQFYWQITNQILENLKQPSLTPLFATRLATYLTYNYFIYADLYQNIFTQLNPQQIIVLGSSPHELTAKFVAKKLNISVKNLSLGSLSWLNQKLNHFFLNREYQLRINRFISQSKFKKPTKKTLNKNTLLSLDFYRHLKTLTPLYTCLKKKKLNPLFVTDIPNLDTSLSNLKIPQAESVYLASFIDKAKLANLLIPANLSIKLKSTPVNLQDFLYNLSLTTAKPLITKSLIMARLYQHASQELFKIINPKSVVVVSDSRFIELSLTQQAKKNKIPSLMVSPNTALDRAQLNQYSTTDKIAVVGPSIKKQLIKIGVNSNKIYVTGDLQLENYQKLKSTLNKESIYQKLNIKDNRKKIILLISFRPNWYITKEEKQAFITIASRAVQKDPNLVLVIKPHPTEKRYRIIDELKQWGIEAIVTDNNQLELVDLLFASSVVLQTWSMTIFEAIMMNRPVISINPFKKDYDSFLPIIKSGGAIEIFNQAQLEKKLSIMINPAYSETKQQLAKAKQASVEFIKSPDNKVAQKVVKLL